MGVFFVQVWLAVFFGYGGWPPAYDDAVTALVVDLGYGRVETRVGRLVEGDADEAGGQIGGVSWEAPGDTAALVVQRCVDVPGSCGFVLVCADPSCAGIFEVGVSGAAANDLDGLLVAE